MRKLVAVVMLALGGCTIFPLLDKGIENLIGQPQNVALDALGPPTRQTIFEGDRVYIWLTDFEALQANPSSGPVSGTINGTRFTGRMTTTEYSSSHFDCTLRIRVDSKDIILAAHYSGNSRGCETFAYRLKNAPPPSRIDSRPVP